MTSLYRSPLILSLALLALPAISIAAPPETAEEIAARALENNFMSTNDAQAEVVLQVSKKGKVVRTRRIISKTRRREQETRSLVAFESPAEVAGTKFLSIEKKGEPTQQFLYLPAFKKVKRVVGAQRNRSFMGTDFSYADLEGREVSESNWKRLEDSQISKVPVYVIEGRPKQVKDEPYGRSVWYVHRKHLVPMRIDFFDAAQPDVLKKQLKVKRLERRSGRWLATDSVMATIKKKTATRLKLIRIDFDTPLTDAELSRAALER